MESSGHMTGWTLGALPETGNVGEGRRRVWGKREMSSDTLSETDLGPPRGGLGCLPGAWLPEAAVLGSDGELLGVNHGADERKTPGSVRS